MSEKYWVTRTDKKEDLPGGLHNNIEITHVSFNSATEADAYVKKLNDQHHEYMLETHDPTKLGVSYDATTDARIQKGRQLGINYIDKRQ
jgi:hypothetical protein